MTLRLGVRCAARLPIMLGLTFIATGFALVVAVAALSSIAAADWIGDPPGILLHAVLIVAILLCWLVFCPLAWRVGDRHSKRFKVVAEQLLRRYCSSCDYDLHGLDGEVCPECVKSRQTDEARIMIITRQRAKWVDIRQALLCLVLGGVMTVAIAWGCALFPPLQWQANQAVGGPFFEQYSPDDWPELDTLWLEETVRVTDRSAEKTVSIRLSAPSGANGVFEDVTYAIMERRYGIPWRSMHSFHSRVWGAPQVMADPNFPVHSQPDFPPLARGIDIPAWIPRWIHWRTLPLRPMWPGFLYSTLVYGAFAWLLLCIPGFLRTRRQLRRLRRGLCIYCKYPVDNMAVCPECGKPTGRET